MTRLAWTVAISFALLGAAAGLGRARYVGDYVERVDPVRTRIFSTLGLTDPRMDARAALVRRVDSKFGESRATTYAHVLIGTTYLLACLFQFSAGIRRRNIAYHRWAGRVLIVAGVVAAITGMYFGMVRPLAGIPEAVIIAVVGTAFLFAVARAYIAIRRKDRETHRAWMIRAFALMLSVTTVRLVAIPIDLILTPQGVTTETEFAIALSLGWGLTIVGAEWWLARTRRPSVPVEAVRLSA